MTDRKQRSDSLTSQIEAARSHKSEYQVPAGLGALTKLERTAWNQYCLARDSWKAAELRTLFRIVKLETEIKKLEREARKHDRFYKRANGDWVQHPIHAEIRNQRKLLQSDLRVIGLQTSTERKVGAGAGGKLEKPEKPEPGKTSPKGKLSLLK